MRLHSEIEESSAEEDIHTMCIGPHLVSRDGAGCEYEWCGHAVALTRLYAYTVAPCQPGIKTRVTRPYTREQKSHIKLCST